LLRIYSNSTQDKSDVFSKVQWVFWQDPLLPNALSLCGCWAFMTDLGGLLGYANKESVLLPNTYV
jgi:hypothetical protein